MLNPAGSAQAYGLGRAREWAMMGSHAPRHCHGARATGQSCTPTAEDTGTTPGPTETSSATATSVSIAIELRIRIQLRISGTATAGETGETDEGAGNPHHEIRGEMSRAERAQLREARHELRHLGKAVRSALREFARQADVTPEVRAEIRDIAKQFRHDLRAALRGATHDGVFDTDALVAGARDALGTLVSELRSLAESLGGNGADVQPNLPVTPEVDLPVDTAPTVAPQATGTLEMVA